MNVRSVGGAKRSFEGVGLVGSSHVRYQSSTVFSHFSPRGIWARNEIRWPHPTTPTQASEPCVYCRVQGWGWLLWWFCQGPVLLLLWELLGEALLGIFCSCIAATWPYTVFLLTNREVIKLSNTLGAQQVGGSSRKLRLLLCDYIAVYEECFPCWGTGFQMKVRASNWACDALVFLFKNDHQCRCIPLPVLCVVIYLVALESQPWIHILHVGSEQGSGVQLWEHLIWSQTEFLTTVTHTRPPQFLLQPELLLQFGWNWNNAVGSTSVSHGDWEECMSWVKQMEGQSSKLRSCSLKDLNHWSIWSQVGTRINEK